MEISVTGLSEAIAHLKQLNKTVPEKTKLLIQKLAQSGIEVARVQFGSATYAGPSVQTNEGIENIQVRDIVWVSDNEAKIIAEGEKVLFVEFGSGRLWAETHPKGAELGFVPGAVAKVSNAEWWAYYGELGPRPPLGAGQLRNKQGEPVTDKFGNPKILNKGNPPARAMYDAGRTMHQEFERIAKEVFK